MVGHCKWLVAVLVCLVCMPLSGQEKAFKAGLKKGKNAEGYYHADLSRTAFSREHLDHYARNNGLILKNLKEEEVVQFGTLYTAVVSLDFLPVSELTGGRDVSPAQRELLSVLSSSFNEQGGKDIVTYGQEIDLGKDRYDKEDLKQAGLMLDYVLYKIVTGGGGLFGPVPERFYFLSKKGLEDLVFKWMNGGKAAPFTSVGNALEYPYSERRFREITGLKWTGSTVNGRLDGAGLGYVLDEGNATIRCVTGRFDKGNPTGECRFYSLTVKELVEGNPVPAIVNVHPFREGIARCDVRLKDYDYVAFVNDRFENVIDDINRFSYELLRKDFAATQQRARVVREFENGTAVLAWTVGGADVEYIIDKTGKALGITDKAQSAIDVVLDEVASHYDRYLMKVLNPTDVLHPVTSLKSRFNYNLDQFPVENYKSLTVPEFLQPAVKSYRSRKSAKPDLAYHTYLLLRKTSNLESSEKERSESDLFRRARTIDLTQGFIFNERKTNMSDFAYLQKYDSFLRDAKSYMDEIGGSSLKPKDFIATRAAVENEFTKTSVWWAGLYKRASNILADRHQSAAKRMEEYKRSMCEKCLVDGKKSTFPKGFIEAYEGIFFSRPAQSETDGELVLMNGEKCTWKYVYYGSKREIELSGRYNGTFDSEDEMINTILKECNDYWGRK